MNGCRIHLLQAGALQNLSAIRYGYCSCAAQVSTFLCMTRYDLEAGVNDIDNYTH